ncbi:hypothetical protein mru_1797 [Methanobrevibacter ruminantium M1]|uniref:Uncharacterized protein n=1 Tax=Methanobrevibacter ruminantium (strain ATCC 35063 / DSM 1093 / JCM 13430 / OCM 146 / M1) TaxID=634498 RepID=D3DZG9_METRM|nr:hypothetical protein [Methanobrevibacter ruminantium]ADC47647.1 hypothetical protein mru_1797 [Methanobrevibacter ruminantium M1]
MRSLEEIGAKIEELNDKIAGIRAEDEENLTNELKVILAGSELQSIILTSTLTSKEQQVRDLLDKFVQRGDELNERYEEASIEDDAAAKNQLHAMIWTNDIRIDTLKWVLEEEDVGI